MAELYFVGVFVFSFASFISFLTVAFYYIVGFKQSDRMFIVPLITCVICMIGLLFMLYVQKIYASLPWLVVLVVIGLVLLIIPIFTLKKTYISMGCFTLGFIVNLVYAVGILVCFILPYLQQAGSPPFICFFYYVSPFIPCLLSFSLLLSYIENTKRKILDTTYEQWVDRGDGSFWKFGK